MKQIFYLFLMLAAALFTFSACGDDDDNGGNNGGDNGNGDASYFQDDLSALIDMSYDDMIKLYHDPIYSEDNYYVFDDLGNTIASLFISVNPENQQVYHVCEILKDEAYALEDIKAYFDKYFTFYFDKTEEENIDDETTVEVTTYFYGNAEKEEDATLFIEVRDDNTIYYFNPKNFPEQ